MSTSPASLSSADSSICSGFPGDRAERGEDALPERGAAARREAPDRRNHLLLHGRRPEHRHGAVAERHDADPDRARLSLREGRGRRLRRLHPGRLEIVGPHAVRHVEGEDHRPLPLREREAHRRPGEPDADEDERDREQRERDVSSPPEPASGRRGRHEPLGREAIGAPRPPTDEPHVREHEERDDREPEQHPRRAERHQARRRFRDSTMRDDGGDEVVGGRDLADVDARTEGCRPQLRFAVLAGHLAGGAGTRRRSSRRRAAHRSRRPRRRSAPRREARTRGGRRAGSRRPRAARSVAAEAAPIPGAVMKSETRTTRDRRRIVRCAVSSSRGEVGDRSVRLGRPAA